MNAANELPSATSTESRTETDRRLTKTFIQLLSRVLVASVLLYLVSRFLIYWLDWPTLTEPLNNLLGTQTSSDGATEHNNIKGLLHLLLYIGVFTLLIASVKKTTAMSLSHESEQYKKLSYFIVRVAFWSVFLIGIVDATISFLRVEELLIPVFGETTAQTLDQATQRGLYVHYPLILLSFVIAWFSKSLGFIWLAFLVVLAEFAIVITRFVFSYEQAFMGDLVRFWYAAFFLFASAYSLIEGGHVRVDVFYARMKNKKKAWVNALGSLFLGLPVCWTILHYGMGSRQSSLIAPILSFETSPSGYGLYVKYLMAAFLIIFAVSMAIIFVSYFLKSCAYLFNEPDAELPSGGEH